MQPTDVVCKHVFILAALLPLLIAAPLHATDMELIITSPNRFGDSLASVNPGQSVAFSIQARLLDDLSEGLASISLDLHFTGGPLHAQTVDLPPGDASCARPMASFVEPLGQTGPSGFGGMLVDGDLVGIGGAQNTMNYTPEEVESPIGEVITKVAQPRGCPGWFLEIARGSTQAPPCDAPRCTFELQALNVLGDVIRDGETGEVIWATEPVGAVIISNLRISVLNAMMVVGSKPVDEGSLTHTAKNEIELRLASPLHEAPPGSFFIQELLPEGRFGSDVAAAFSVSLLDEGMSLKLRDSGAHLTNRRWYAVRNTPGSMLGEFERHFVVFPGDVDQNGLITALDVGQVVAAPAGRVPEGSRFDINNDGFRTAIDVGLVNANLGPGVPKPSGH